MRRSDSLETKACCKITSNWDVSEELLEWSRRGATVLGRGRHAELPCSFQPINLRAASEGHVPAPARADSCANVMQELEEQSGSIGAASRLSPPCCSHGGPSVWQLGARGRRRAQRHCCCFHKAFPGVSWRSSAARSVTNPSSLSAAAAWAVGHRESPTSPAWL